jgi:hypothetical protein
VEAPLRVPQVEREAEQVRFPAGAELREAGVAERVRGRGRNDVDLDSARNPGFARRDREATGRKRDVSCRGQGSGRRDGKLDQSDAHEGLHHRRNQNAPRATTTLCGSAGMRRAFRPAQEAVMKTIRENLYPAAVLICWMMSSAYTIYLVA